MNSDVHTLVNLLRDASSCVDHAALVARCHRVADDLERLESRRGNERYAVVHHGRWLETEEPRATVIRTWDGQNWHDVCTTDPETAQEIAEALDGLGEFARVHRVLALAVTRLAGRSDRPWQEVLDDLEREERARQNPLYEEKQEHGDD